MGNTRIGSDLGDMGDKKLKRCVWVCLACLMGVLLLSFIKQQVLNKEKKEVIKQTKEPTKEEKISLDQLEQLDKIRVLLLNQDGKQGHKSISISSKGEYFIVKNKKKTRHKKGSSLTIKANELKNGETIKITTKEKTEKIQVSSLKKMDKHPSYRGELLISKKEGEGLILVNELGIEEYLYGVIGSEMPASYGLDALKVQAVCARSYAYRQITEDACKDYGAHVDDSISFQVYNMVGETKETIRAVKETKGQVLAYQGEVIPAYYFSTSCGYTAAVEDVWQGSQAEYLQGGPQWDTKKDIDLSNEEAFEEFISMDTYKTYDQKYPWYRWRTRIDGKSLGRQIAAHIAKRYEKTPELILTKQKDGAFVSQKIDGIGAVKSMNVLERGKSGVVKSLEIVGAEKTVKIISEYNLRLLLAPVGQTVYRMDDSQIEGMNMLPSGFFFLREDKKKNSFVFVGGGYGHGVGMSQNGAKAMLDSGNSYESVLAHYYNGASICQVP